MRTWPSQPLPLIFILGTLLPMAATAGIEPAVNEASEKKAGAIRLVPLDVQVNGSSGGQWVLLEQEGKLYAPEEAFAEWRLSHHPATAPLEYRGQKWMPLNAVPGFVARYNYANQSVELLFSPEAFEATRLDQASRHLELSPSIPAVFLNYDLSYTDASYRNAPGSKDLGTLTEFGLSAGGGVLTSSYVGHNLSNNASAPPKSWRRLETAYARDYPDDNLSVKLGDSSTRPGTWGRTVYFGGLQISRNFALTPGFITQPIPVVGGTSSAPSTVELYVNDVLRQTSTVPTGPFTIDNFPLLTSSGDARMVVKDALGRETVIQQSFFSHPSMLEQGLNDWSLEAGAARRNLGLDNASYGQRFGSGLLRHGVSKSLTIEGRAEYGQTTRDAGLGASFELPLQMLGQLAASASDDSAVGKGSSWMMGIDKNSLTHNFSMRMDKSTVNFRQIGLQTLPYRRQLSANYSHTFERSGSIGVGAARIETFTNGTLTTYSGNYSARVLKQGALTFTAARVLGNTSGYSFGAAFLMPLDNQVNLTSHVTRKPGGTDGYVSLNKGLSASTGTGWRMLAGNRTGRNYGEGGLYYQGDHALLTSDVSASSSQQTMRLGAQGGFVLMDGHAFMTRRVDQSFALVEVPGYADVGVGFQSSVLTHTNKDGVALVPRLLPYQSNSIRLDPTELPISAELDSIEQTVVPRGRSGVKVVFPVRSGRGALIRIVLADGREAPPGATVTLQGDQEAFYVARHGEVFVTGLQPENLLHLQLDEGGSCSFSVTLPPANQDEIPRIGPIPCDIHPAETTTKGTSP